MGACAKSANYVANQLEIPGFTGDLLFKFVLAYLQPTMKYNGEIPFKHKIDDLKSKGTIPTEPQQHLWYDIWNFALKNKKGIWQDGYPIFDNV
jgi:hypothetical protein